ncbi:lysoplasmalogenase [uncultured Muriicola sp.]|uniref:lysoplasmalogenase n=1 Tax=uncultured Muriicola sp. TaxID=1583102 RepID=UPI00261F4D87|nr:lysoplasmalogenase [uncultured Muriicola sp.]
MFVAFLAIFFNASNNNALFIVLKPLTTILIILFTVFFGIRKNKFYKWVVIALIFCLAGDTLLLKEAYFIWGLLAFLMAHLCFSFSFMSLGGFKFYLIPLILLIVFGIGYYWILYDGLQALKIPVLTYFIVILFMGWQGISLRIWKNEAALTLVAFAVLFFITSDALLAWAKFKEPFRWDGVLILATYWISIFSIGLSTTIERKKSY